MSRPTSLTIREWLTTTILIVFIGLQFGACSTPSRNALPETMVASARIPDVDDAFFWGDQIPRQVGDQRAATVKRTKRMAAKRGGTVLQQPIHYLALSGGGSDGAFGAGILSGWSLTGKRPVFTVVTGISTGAIIAPFAFLGSDYDSTLREIYTQYRTEDALAFRSIFGALKGEAAADVTGMQHLICRYIDEAVVRAIAVEHNNGRLLFIGTTNLDAGRPVIWNIGRIAASGAPHSLSLIQDIILASASIPGVFPPVMIEYEADGRQYEEMHVDGGVSRQVFLFPAGLQWHEFIRELGFSGGQHLYIILNGNLVHSRKVVKHDIFSISARSIQVLTKSQGVGDLYKLFLIAHRNDMSYNLAFIPADFSEEPEEMFDLDYMQSLFGDLALNHFIRLADDRVLALRLFGRTGTEDTPYSDKSRLGQGSDLRGFKSGEISGRTLLSGQVEHRWQFTERWGAVAFGGLSKLWDDDLEALITEGIYYNGGVGIRFMINTDQKINFRIDAAVGNGDNKGIYVGIREAF